MGGASVMPGGRPTSNELVAPAHGNDEQPPDPGRGPSPGFLRDLGIGEQGAPGPHTREGHEATKDIEIPGAPGAGAPPADHAATWAQFGATAEWQKKLAPLDPASLSNFRHGSGMLPDLARGAGAGNGASTIISNRARTRPKDATRPRLAAALLRPKGQPAAAAPHVGRALGYAPAGTTSRRGGCGKMCPPRASTETGEDCSTSSRLYIFPRPPLPC